MPPPTPRPARAEAGRPRLEVSRLVDALARGDVSEVDDAIRDRKRRLARLEEQ